MKKTHTRREILTFDVVIPLSQKEIAYISPFPSSTIRKISNLLPLFFSLFPPSTLQESNLP